MNRILELLIKDFQNEVSSEKYQLKLKKFCKVENDFIATLNKKQKAKYLELDFVCGELSVVELCEFAEFLFKHIR